MARITFILPGLGCGGIQRSAVNVIHGLNARGHHIEVITFSDGARDLFALPANVPRHALGLSATRPTQAWRLLDRTFTKLARLRAAVHATDPEVVIAHAPHINVAARWALTGLHYPLILTEHGDTAVTGYGFRRAWRKWLWYRLRRISYGGAEKVVSVSQAVDNNVSWLAEYRRTVIHNAFSSPPGACSSRIVDAKRPVIASMGRLVHGKGFEDLLDAFQIVAPRFRDWDLVIIGDGPLRAALTARAKLAGLADRVTLTGTMSDPQEVLVHATLFVLASHYEGFPMSLGEALACGVPAIATDCPSRAGAPRNLRAGQGGVRELIQDGVNGVLVPPQDVPALARAMSLLMSDPVARQRLAAQAPISIQRFAPERVLGQWEQVIAEAMHSRCAVLRQTGSVGQ